MSDESPLAALGVPGEVMVSSCAHCYHVESRKDCAKTLSWERNSEIRCCKCGRVKHE